MATFGSDAEGLCDGKPCEYDIDETYFWKNEEFVNDIKVSNY